MFGLEDRFAYQIRRCHCGRNIEGGKKGFRMGCRSRLATKEPDEEDSEWQFCQSEQRPDRHDGGVRETFGGVSQSGMADNHRVGENWWFAVCIGTIIRPFDNMRMSRSNEVDREFGSIKESLWIGHSERVKKEHYYRLEDSDFDEAAGAS